MRPSISRRFHTQAPQWITASGAVDRIVPLSAKKADASLDDLLAEDAAAPQVAVVGSSYSANAKWSFEAQIKAAAGVDVINFAEEGKGPFKPMETFLSEKLPK